MCEYAVGFPKTDQLVNYFESWFSHFSSAQFGDSIEVQVVPILQTIFYFTLFMKTRIRLEIIKSSAAKKKHETKSEKSFNEFTN